MPDRKVYRVSPSGGGWILNGPGQSATFKTKTEATSKGRQVARSSGLGQLVVQGKDGRIQAEYTYGKDPRQRKG